MNISDIGKHVLIGIIATGSILTIPQISSAEIIYCSNTISNECVERQGRGGSNALVVEELRQETYRNRKYQAVLSTMEIVQNENTIITILSTPSPTVVPYPEKFKTIGEVQAELAALEKEVEAEAELAALEKEVEASLLSEEISQLARQSKEKNCSSQFSDITGNRNQSSIEILDCMNIISGRENGKFSPDSSITRKEVIKISLLITGEKITPRKQSSIYDIDDNDWSVPYTETAIETELIDAGNLEGETAVTNDEAFALYLFLTKIGVEANNNTKEFMDEAYITYKDFIIPEYTIVNYEVHKGEITRGEFAKLSLYILQILRRDDEFEGPTQQLNDPQFSASQTEPVNPNDIFPEIFLY